MADTKQCGVCGTELAPTKETVYTVREMKGLAGIFRGASYFDAMDCPNCGCQVVLVPRLPTIEADDETDGNQTLTDLNPGDTFEYGGRRWVKLDDNGESSLCVTEKCVLDKAFDTDNKNDWRGASLRKWLNNYDKPEFNGGFLGELIKKGGARMEDFVATVSDLTSDDGMTDYGTSEDYVALLSCDLYRKYRAVIPAVDGWYWTLTPWTCNAARSYGVRGVYAGGALDSYHGAYCGSGGVRPLCNFKSGISVPV